MLRSEWGAPVLKAQLLTALFEKAVAQLKALRGDTAVHFFLNLSAYYAAASVVVATICCSLLYLGCVAYQSRKPRARAQRWSVCVASTMFVMADTVVAPAAYMRYCEVPMSLVSTSDRGDKELYPGPNQV